MNFDELSEIITSNINYFKSISPRKNLETILKSMLSYLDELIKNDSAEIPYEDFYDDVNDLFDGILRSVINQKFTDESLTVLNSYVLLCINLNNFDHNIFKNSYLIEILLIIINSARSINDSIRLNQYLYDKLENLLSSSDTNVSLSKKYLGEYRKFLTNEV